MKVSLELGDDVEQAYIFGFDKHRLIGYKTLHLTTQGLLQPTFTGLLSIGKLGGRKYTFFEWNS